MLDMVLTSIFSILICILVSGISDTGILVEEAWQHNANKERHI